MCRGIMSPAENEHVQSMETPEVWVTGLGIVSSLGEGVAAHWAALNEPILAPVVDETSFAPYPVHPLADIDFSTQIARKGDLRQMGQWQRIGVYAAGQALQDAGIAGQRDLLDKTDLIVAAGNGERDEAADANILRELAGVGDGAASLGAILNHELQTRIRPTHYLAELSNLLAGNISIVHGVAGSSRTFKGEEMAGVSAVEDAVRRISSRQGQLFLVGGAFNAERADLSVVFELCDALWRRPYQPVYQRSAMDGGFIMGSLGVFLVLESDAHALARGKSPYARITSIASGSTGRSSHDDTGRRDENFLLDDLVSQLQDGPLGVLSGASGVEPATGRERKWTSRLGERGVLPVVRAYGTMLGHSVEAQFPAGVALAALAISKGAFYPPFETTGQEQPLQGSVDHILVTGWGHWRGEGIALVETASFQ